MVLRKGAPTATKEDLKSTDNIPKTNKSNKKTPKGEKKYKEREGESRVPPIPPLKIVRKKDIKTKEDKSKKVPKFSKTNPERKMLLGKKAQT